MNNYFGMRPQVRTTSYNKKMVQIADEVTEDVIRGATVAVVTECSWHIFGKIRAHSFDLVNNPLPKMTCPVLDVSLVFDNERSTDLIAGMIEGRYSLTEFIAGMKALGAREAYSQ